MMISRQEEIVYKMLQPLSSVHYFLMPPLCGFPHYLVIYWQQTHHSDVIINCEKKKTRNCSSMHECHQHLAFTSLNSYLKTLPFK